MYTVREFPMDVRILAMMMKPAYRPHFIFQLVENADDQDLISFERRTTRFYEGTYEGKTAQVIMYLHLDLENYPQPILPARGTLWLIPDYPSRERYLEILIEGLMDGTFKMEIVEVGGEFDAAYVEAFLDKLQHALTTTEFG